MFAMLWPLILVVCSNILYNIASKSIPADCSPYAALVITYLTACVLSLAGFFIFGTEKNLLAQLAKINWTGYCLGLSMVGLEVGYIYMYRNGWKISVASLVSNMILALALLLIGMSFYGEQLNGQQLLGIAFCVAGLFLLMTARV